ncbi:MAG: hypothetical protein ACI36V_01145 [Coriobacteriales bacterium]
MASNTTGNLALKSASARRFAVIEGGATATRSNSYPSLEEQLFFDDERCFSYNSEELSRACSGIRVRLIYAASLLLMVGGLALVTLL